MNYLQLCQRACREFGMSGAGPTTVTGLTGEYKRLSEWIATAWDDIQIEHPDWFWLRESFSFTTTGGDRQYSSSDAGIASRFAAWDTQSFRLYKTSQNDEIELEPISYEMFRTYYIVGPQTQGRPLYAAVDPSLDLLLGPTPDAVYTVSGEYFKSSQSLSVDSDTPEMPSQFHMAIVYRAMMLYGRYEGAPELIQDGAVNYRRILRQLSLNQLPTFDLPGALA